MTEFNHPFFNVGIDASRIRSGGGVSHLEGILSSIKIEQHPFDKVYLWGYRSLLKKLPDYNWLHKTSSPWIEMSLPFQIFWQRFLLPRELIKSNCKAILNLDAGSVCPFFPCVTISQDMLPFEPNEMSAYSFGWSKIRLILLRYIQSMSLKNATEVIFLTNYAAKKTMETTGEIPNYTIVNHGINNCFRSLVNSNGLKKMDWLNRRIRCIYISPIIEYKHQWNVIEAIGRIRRSGIDISLDLIGGSIGKAEKKVAESIAANDPNKSYVHRHAFVEQNELPKHIEDSDIFVFASSCENMPITLMEGMAMGKAITCSDCGPMPEVLQDGGVYFNPYDSNEIEKAILSLINDRELASTLAERSFQLSQNYTWENCSKKTFELLARVAKQG